MFKISQVPIFPEACNVYLFILNVHSLVMKLSRYITILLLEFPVGSPCVAFSGTLS